jgi:hypothetical protein
MRVADSPPFEVQEWVGYEMKGKKKKSEKM